MEAGERQASDKGGKKKGGIAEEKESKNKRAISLFIKKGLQYIKNCIVIGIKSNAVYQCQAQLIKKDAYHRIVLILYLNTVYFIH